MKLIVAGSRSITDYNIVRDCIEDVEFWDISEIISGDATGVDSLAEKFAHENGYKFTLFPADWSLHGKGAGFLRNEQMAQIGDYLLAIWDARSRGTQHMIQCMLNKNKPVRVEVFKSNG